MKIFVDIDGTICETPYVDGKWNYRESVPTQSHIDKINKLYEEGNEIVYWTARGSSTGMDWSELTEQQLKSWGCKYTRIETQKKPSFDLFIDDKAMRIEELDG